MYDSAGHANIAVPDGGRLAPFFPKLVQLHFAGMSISRCGNSLPVSFWILIFFPTFALEFNHP